MREREGARQRGGAKEREQLGGIFVCAEPGMVRIES